MSAAEVARRPKLTCETICARRPIPLKRVADARRAEQTEQAPTRCCPDKPERPAFAAASRPRPQGCRLALVAALPARRGLMAAHDLGQVFATEQLPQRNVDEHGDRGVDSLPFQGRPRLIHANRSLCVDQRLDAGRSGQPRSLLGHACDASSPSKAQHLHGSVTLLLNSVILELQEFKASTQITATAEKSVISYLRVSTARQGRSGLGLEAQRTAVEQHVAANGYRFVGEYVEVESARRDSIDSRPQLQNAIAHAKRAGAALVIAKLDRLARSVYVTAQLHVSGVDFEVVDIPFANRFTIQILAAVAEYESKQISERTKAAMAVANARGRVFGTPSNLSASGRVKGSHRAAESRKRDAAEAYSDLVPLVQQLRSDGMTLRGIADHLNALGHMTRRQRPWTKVQVHRLLLKMPREKDKEER